MRLTVSLIAALGAAAVFAPAATAQQGPPPGCDDIEGAHDFDFWVGDWNVYGQNGQLGGTNHIEKRSNGCLILEEWTNAGGGDGTSMNYLDPTSGQWRQIWMGSNSYIDYSGGLNEAGAMVLVGEITYFGATGSQTAPFRGTWTPNEDGSVTQHFQQYDEANDVWNDWFIGRYVRQEDDPNAN